MKNIINKFKNPLVIRILILFIVASIIGGGIFFFLKKEGRVSIEDSLVDTPIIPIAPTVPGKLTNIYVIEGQKVKEGDALAVVGSEVLRAYADGIITQTNKQFGSLISGQNPPIQMINPNEMRISGTIDENKGLNKIKVSQVVSFTIDALPGKTFWGFVDEISPSAKQTQLTFSISSTRPTQQFIVYSRFNSLVYPEIKNGMSAKMTVFTK